jgi:hypothetical protein
MYRALSSGTSAVGRVAAGSASVAVGGGVVALGAVVGVAGRVAASVGSLAAVAAPVAVGATGREVAVGVVAEGAQALVAMRTSKPTVIRRVPV